MHLEDTLSGSHEEYSEYKTNFPRPQSSPEGYMAAVEGAIADFSKDNQVFTKISQKNFTITDYHRLLTSIFHQVFYSSTSFAIAGGMLAQSNLIARDYLFHHAEEEKDHWIWILQDLESTGYKGEDPRCGFPNPAAQAYLSYGVFLSMMKPLGRLAMANVLEGISARYGLSTGKNVVGTLGITKEQAKFFILHGELDQGHSQDIVEVLKASQNVSAEDWAELSHIARTTAVLYRNIYNF